MASAPVGFVPAARFGGDELIIAAQNALQRRKR